MDELVAWLRAQLDEDEQAARYAGGAWHREGINSVLDADGRLVVYGDGSAPNGTQADHMVRHDPARVLADVAWKRGILDEHGPEEVASLESDTWAQTFIVCRRCRIGERQVVAPCPTVRLLASMYAHCEGYREEWRPE